MQHFAANYLFDGEKLIKNAFVSVDDDGTILNVSEENQALTEQAKMQFLNGIICPGFVNTHCHLELSDIKYENSNQKGLSNFINSMIVQRNRIKNLHKIKIADDTMFIRGINLCGDIVNTTDTLDIKLNSKIKYINFAEQSGIFESESQNKLMQIESIASKFENAGIETTVVPHALYSVSDSLLSLIASKCNSKVISIHFMESTEELEFYKGELGNLHSFLHNIDPKFANHKTSIKEVYAKLTQFKKAISLILVHNVKTDINYLGNRHNIHYCLCPSSNILLHNELPEKDFVYQNKENIAIGTDSLASNERLDIYHELKIVAEKYPELSLTDLLKMITSNGAFALAKHDFGKLKCGTKPGLVLICDADIQNLKLGKSSYSKRII